MKILLEGQIRRIVVELVTPRVELLRMVDDSLIKLLYFTDEELALVPVGVFELGNLSHDLVRVGVQVLEGVRLDFTQLCDLAHLRPNIFILIVNLVFQCLHISLCLGYFYADLVEDVQLVVAVKHCLADFFNFLGVSNAFIAYLSDQFLVVK